MVARSLELWREHEERWKCNLYRKTGALWLAHAEDEYEKASLSVLRDVGLEFEKWSVEEAAKHFPQFHFENVSWVLYEYDAGYLLARRACQKVWEGFLAEGGEYRQLSVKPGRIQNGILSGLCLSDGSILDADRYVFACGPWMGKLFPDVVGDRVRSLRQEVFYFGAPAGDDRFHEDAIPVWIDNGKRRMYGIPGNEWRGFKVAEDARGTPFDPTTGDRSPSAAALESAKKYLRFRFPELAEAPLLESRVCQYEESPDSDFIMDRHPEAENVWIVGGGSGHGFKHGPAIGELTSRTVLEKQPVEPTFALSRFSL
jgi:glycine/D-amino acid oxidase-like deaminating enzyme